jgi:hypothetical protein
MAMVLVAAAVMLAISILTVAGVAAPIAVPSPSWATPQDGTVVGIPFLVVYVWFVVVELLYARL